MSGRRIVGMVWEDLKPSDILDERSYEDAVTAVMALGGSTNAVIHLVALARRSGVALDLARFDDLRRRGIIPDAFTDVLYVLGRYTENQQSSPIDLVPFLAADGARHAWTVCAFGHREHACAVTAAAMGGHVRVGFENNLHLKDGTLAPDNAALVADVAAAVQALGRPLANADTVRSRLSH